MDDRADVEDTADMAVTLRDADVDNRANVA